MRLHRKTRNIYDIISAAYVGRMEIKMQKKRVQPRRAPAAPLLPKETLEIVDRRELLLAGVLGISDYNTEKVCVKTTKGIVEVEGSAISLCWAGEKRLLLRGCFASVRFENKFQKKKGGF